MYGAVDVGERIFAYREARGWTQGETAARARVSPTTVSNIENGRNPHPRMGTIRRLARAFGVSTDEFLSGALPKAPSPSSPEHMLLEGEGSPGHDYLAHSLPETLTEAEDMSASEIRERIRALCEENAYLKTLRAEDFPPDARRTPDALKNAREAVSALRRGYVGRVAALAEIGAAKEGSEQALRELEAEVARALSEAAI